MKITESEKNRIRGLHRDASVIKEDWGSKKDEYKRTDGHRSGDVDGHYKAYEGETEFNEMWGSKEDEYKRSHGHRTGNVDGHYKDYEGEANEAWGSKKDEYKRSDGHRTGDVDGHYKDYEGIVHEDEFPFSEDEGDVIGVDRPESAAAQAKFNESSLNEDSEGEETYHYGEDEGEDHDEEMDLEHDEDMAPHDRVDAIQRHLDALKKDMSYDEDHEDRDERGDDFE